MQLLHDYCNNYQRNNIKLLVLLVPNEENIHVDQESNQNCKYDKSLPRKNFETLNLNVVTVSELTISEGRLFHTPIAD